MAEPNKGPAKPAGQPGAPDNMAAARAARVPKDGKASKLTFANRFALNALLQAARACKILAAEIRSGETVSSECVSAACTLSGAVASQIMDE